MNAEKVQDSRISHNIHEKYEISYFIGKGISDEVTCFYSSNSDFLAESHYNIFEIPSLLNRLAKTSNTITKDVFNKLSRNKEDIVFIEQWDLFAKKVIILKPKELDNISTSKREQFLIRKDFANKFFRRGFN